MSLDFARASAACSTIAAPRCAPRSGVPQQSSDHGDLALVLGGRRIHNAFRQVQRREWTWTWTCIYASFAGMGAASRRRSRRRVQIRRYAQAGDARSVRNAEDWVTMQIYAVIAASFLLLLVVFLWNWNELTIDQSLRSFIKSTFDGQHAMFNEWSNKLDDLLIFLSRVAAVALFARGDILAGAVQPIGFESARAASRAAKAYFHRERPSTAFATDGSFPSSHTLRCVFCVAYIVIIALPRLKPLPAGQEVAQRPNYSDILVAVLLGWMSMGSLRMLADAHWCTDTMGGSLIGVGSVALMEAVVEGVPLAYLAFQKWRGRM